MEAVPDQEQLLIFLRKLKEVFDVCDEDADGFIRVEHLVDLGLQFGRGDEESVSAGVSGQHSECDRSRTVETVSLLSSLSSLSSLRF
ncbi:hypothetical protein MHYP_G00149030 [Metynnis hypsauchen]